MKVQPYLSFQRTKSDPMNPLVVCYCPGGGASSFIDDMIDFGFPVLISGTLVSPEEEKRNRVARATAGA